MDPTEEYCAPHSSPSTYFSFPLPQAAHTLPYAEVLKALATDSETGLTTSEASRRLDQYGFNELEQSAGVQPLQIFFEQVFNAMTLVLLLALAASFGIQAWIEGGILGGIIIFNLFLGFFQTLKAEKTIQSLKTLGSPNATVLRGGRATTIQTKNIVRINLSHLFCGCREDAQMLTHFCYRCQATLSAYQPATPCLPTSVS